MTARVAPGVVLVGVVCLTTACSAHTGRPARTLPQQAPRSSGGWTTVRSAAVPLGVGTSGTVLTGTDALVGVSWAAALNSQGGPVSCVKAVPTAGYAVTGGISGPFSPAQALGFNIDAGPVASGHGALALLSTPGELTGDCGTPETLRLASLSLAGGPQSLAVLQQAAEVGGTTIAANSRGDVAAAWLTGPASAQGGARAHDILHVYDQAARAAPASTVSIPDQPTVSGDAVAIDGRGNALVAYSTDREAFAVTVDLRGGVGRAQPLGPCNSACHVVASESPDGRGVIVWDSQSITGDGATSPYVVRAAFRDGPNRPFGSSHVVDAGGIVDDQQAGPPAVAIAPSGRAIVEWANLARPNAAGALYEVRAAIAPPHGAFGPYVGLGDGAPGSVAIRADGTALLTWVATPNPNDTAGPVRASLLAPSAGAPGRAVSLPGSPAGFAPIASFTPTGRAVVAWTATTTNADAVAISTREVP